MKTRAASGHIVREVQQDRPTKLTEHEPFAHHPIRATEEEAAHVREIVDEGESPKTPAFLIGVALAVVIPIATVLMLLAFGIAHFAA